MSQTGITLPQLALHKQLTQIRESLAGSDDVEPDLKRRKLMTGPPSSSPTPPGTITKTGTMTPLLQQPNVKSKAEDNATPSTPTPCKRVRVPRSQLTDEQKEALYKKMFLTYITGGRKKGLFEWALERADEAGLTTDDFSMFNDENGDGGRMT